MKAKVRVPIVFLTGHGDIPMAVRAMKAGAVDFLTKPFREQDLLDAVATALEKDRARRAKELANSALRESLNSLSARERDIVARVAEGALNKQIAADLGVSEVTVKVYRATAMRKLRAKSVADLVRIAVQAEPLLCFRVKWTKPEAASCRTGCVCDARRCLHFAGFGLDRWPPLLCTAYVRYGSLAASSPCGCYRANGPSAALQACKPPWM